MARKGTSKYGQIYCESAKRYYYRICKCGRTKESYKSAYCIDCMRSRKRNRLKDAHRPIFMTDINDYITNMTSKEWGSYLQEFITRIDSRGGMASLNEIMVDLITLYEHYYGINSIPDVSPKLQIEYMWKYIKKVEIEKNTFLEYNI